MIKVLTVQEKEEIRHEIEDIKRAIELRKTFFSKDKPYCQKLTGLWGRVIRAEKELRKRKNA